MGGPPLRAAHVIDQLTAHARDHNPNALRLLNQPDSKTTLSILTTFQTHMRIVSVLAEAWPDQDIATQVAKM